MEYSFKLLQQKNINRINRQIKWGIKVCNFRKTFEDSIDLLIKDRVLPAKLFISNVNLLKLQTNIRHWETSENFKCLLVAITLDRTKEHQIIIKKKTKTNRSKKSSILKSVQKWNKLPSSITTFNYKIFFKHVLTQFFLDQRSSFCSTNRSLEILFLPMRTNSHIFKILILITMLINLVNISKHLDI